MSVPSSAVPPAPPAQPPAAAPAAPRAAPASVAGAAVRQDLVHPDPLLDCLVEVCRLHGQHATRASLSAGLPLAHGRLTLNLVERAASRAGMATKLQRVAAGDIDAATLPVILLLHGDKACVLLGREQGRHRVLLPETGQGTVLLDDAELAARSTGLALYVRPHFRFDKRTEATAAPAQGHWFWSALLAQRLVYKDILWAAALINVFALALPLFSMNVYDRVVPNAAFETLWALSIGVLLILGSDLLMRKLRSRFVDEASARIDVKISASLLERVLGMRLENRPESVGSFSQNLRGFEQVRDVITSTTVTALVDLPFALLFLVVIVWISPWLMIPVVLSFAGVLTYGWIVQKKLHALAETTYKASAVRNATLVECLTGIETIKAQGAESLIQARWERTNVHLAATNVKMRSLSSGSIYVTSTIAQLMSVVLVIVGVYLIGEKSLTMGALVAVNMLAGRAMAPAGQIVGLLMQYQGARTALEGLEKIMRTDIERPRDATFVERRDLEGAIEFRNVAFHYPHRRENALEGVSFKIKPGEKVALIGKVGSGKSTIQRLAMGLFQPTAGAVLVDGIDLRQVDPADLRRNMGYVSQDVLLFYGSLRENIAFGMPYAEDGAIVAAAEVAGLTETVNRHPAGFDMPVGERGESLSGGQRQSVGIARAVLHNAPMLLLDEPTSAMDFSSEAQITQRLMAFASNKTVVLVTHRTSLLALVERVIVIDGGKVVADGPRDRIMEALQSGRIARAQ
ncbi:MAG: type I secretion system permease/ATPase [Burkholderiales bacterium]|nr:type I secretion system permease/ATPase [Burkholderiales bacterium]